MYSKRPYIVCFLRSYISSNLPPASLGSFHYVPFAGHRTATLEPTKGTILRMARECNRHVELVDCLVDGAFGLDQDQFKARMTEMAGTIADKVDVIVFAQGSMAYCEQYIADKFGKVVLSSPRFGAAELKKALEKKGTI